EQRETALDDDLRLGTRDERACVRLQRQSSEVPVTEDVGKRLARAATLHERARSHALGLREGPIVLRVQLDPLQPERACEQQLGIHARALDAARREVLRRAAQNLCERQASRARRRSSAVSASVYSSRSP